MPATYTLIASNTLSSAAASVTFSAIPGTYTDLVLRWSSRTDNASVVDVVLLEFNASGGTAYSTRRIIGTGSAAASTGFSNAATSLLPQTDGANATANTFGSAELYIPSYTISQNKPISSFGCMEDNATTAYIAANAGLWSNTSAITQIKLTSNAAANFVSGSSFFLYGIKNS